MPDGFSPTLLDPFHSQDPTFLGHSRPLVPITCEQGGARQHYPVSEGPTEATTQQHRAVGQSISGEGLGGLLEERASALGPKGPPEGKRQAKEGTAFNWQERGGRGPGGCWRQQRGLESEEQGQKRLPGPLVPG